MSEKENVIFNVDITELNKMLLKLKEDIDKLVVRMENVNKKLDKNDL